MVAVKNFLVIVAEIGLLLLIFTIIKWLIRKTCKQLIKVVSANNIKITIQNIQKNIQVVLTISSGFLCLVVLGWNGWLIYKGKNLLEYTNSLISSIPKEFWVNLGMGAGRSLCLLFLVAVTQPYLDHLLNKWCDYAKKYDQITANDESVEAIFDFIDINLTNIIWLFCLALCSQFLQVPEAVTKYMYVAVNTYLIVIVGLLLIQGNTVIIDTLDALSSQYSYSNKLLRFYGSISHLSPLSKRCLEYVLYLSMATLVLQQLDFIAELAAVGPKIIQIIGIFYISRVFEEVGKLLTRKFLMSDKDDIAEIHKKRQQTLLPLFDSTLKYVIYCGAIIAMLNILNVDPTPILASAGIVGLAVSMGAQSIVQDLVAGIFNLFEGYYLVGDFVEIDGIAGYVTAIELKTTRINDGDKNYIVRNGEIASITNYSQYSEAAVTVGVAYDSNLNRVYKVIEEVGQQLQENHEDVIAATEVDGVERFGRDRILIETTTKVKPGKHEDIERYLRKMILDAFEREGIKMPRSSYRESMNHDTNDIEVTSFAIEETQPSLTKVPNKSGMNTINYQKLLKVKTTGKSLSKITYQVQKIVVTSGVKTGICHLFLRHNSASLIIQENANPNVLVELESFFSKLVPEGNSYIHTAEGPDDMPAHIRSALIHTSEQIPINNGKLVLGTGQGIYVWEHRQNSHVREIVIHISGE